MSRIRRIFDINNVIDMYNRGISPNNIANIIGVNRTTINRHLVENGIVLRGQSEACKLKWSKMTETERKRQVQKAHQTVRGTKHSIATKIKTAKSFYQRGLRVGLFEIELIEILSKYFTVRHQVNIGIYNIDIAIDIPPIAIEVQMNNRSKITTPKSLQRIKYISSKGFFIIYIISLDKYASIDLFSVAQKIISFIQVNSSNHSIYGKYMMIGGDGKPFPSDRYNFNNLTRIE